MKLKSIRVFLVDDHPIVREGVRSFLTNHGVGVVGEASCGKEAIRKILKLKPDIVVLDVNMPLMDGGELALRLRKLIPGTRLIALSIHSGEEYTMRMAHCGVCGYVLKDQPTDKLLEAIRKVYAGGRYFPAGLPGADLLPQDGPEPAEQDDSELTERELEVLALLSSGASNRSVAGKLGISVRTAETHRGHLAHKLNILTVAGLTKYAIRHGLTELK